MSEARPTSPCRQDNVDSDDLAELLCGVFLADARGGLRFASSWVREVLGIEGPGWIDRLAELSPDGRPTADRWRGLFRSGEDWERELRIEGPSIGKRTVLFRAHLVRDDAGAPDCWLGVCLDISRRARRKHRRLEEMEQLGRLAEREEISREIHAGIQQLLYAVKMHLGVLRRADDAGELRDRSETIRQLIDETIQVSRDLAAQLKPPVEEGLGTAVRWLAAWMQEKHGLELELPDEIEDDDLPVTITVVAIDVLRELAFNVVKHAGVERARVEIRVADGRLHCAVVDRGRGFDPTSFVADETEGPTATSFGLRDIRTRIESVGGTVSIESAPGRGTTVRFSLPIPPAST